MGKVTSSTKFHLCQNVAVYKKKLIVAAVRNNIKKSSSSIQGTKNRITGSKPEAHKQQIPFVFQ
jgi:uncharacterized protein YajQ (UPF0234 family)